jgi:anti-sigma regulatory factor (Ser/Thr protein kinase)
MAMVGKKAAIFVEPNFDVDLYELEPRGAGLYFMNKLMDEIHFEFDTGDGNLLTMIKRK